MEQNGIDLVYGMEWLSKNGRTAEENAELVKKNPFIPYSILMERSFLEQISKERGGIIYKLPDSDHCEGRAGTGAGTCRFQICGLWECTFLCHVQHTSS